jgi:cardiolipin synthase
MVNIPNIITLIRIFLVPVFIMSVFYGKFKEALGIFFFAALSDALDGFLARKFNKVTMLGVILDPLADKALIDSGYFLLSYTGKYIPIWLTVIVLSRDVLILMGSWILSIFNKMDRIKPTYLGKATAFLQFFTLLATLLKLNCGFPNGSILGVLFFTTAIFTVASALQYTYRGIKELNGA